MARGEEEGVRGYGGGEGEEGVRGYGGGGGGGLEGGYIPIATLSPTI